MTLQRTLGDSLDVDLNIRMKKILIERTYNDTQEKLNLTLIRFEFRHQKLLHTFYIFFRVLEYFILYIKRT